MMFEVRMWGRKATRQRIDLGSAANDSLAMIAVNVVLQHLCANETFAR